MADSRKIGSEEGLSRAERGKRFESKAVLALLIAIIVKSSGLYISSSFRNTYAS